MRTQVRVLYFINGFDPGGAEHGLLTLVRHGFFSGHTLRIVGMCRGRGALAGVIAAEAGSGCVTIFDDQEELRTKAAVLAVPALAREIRRFRPDMVILSLKQANLVGRFVLRFFPNVRCISFEHTSRYRAHRGTAFYVALLRLLSGRVDEVWADCQQTLDATRGYFGRRSRRETVVPLFSADEERAVKTDFNIGKKVRIAAAGRLIDVKNFDQLVRAIRKINEEGYDAELTIFGDGLQARSLRNLVRSLGLEERVSLPGYVSRWYNEAVGYDLFVNVSDTEGFCIVVAEAMTGALPVIATNVGGIREYGRHRENMWKIKDETEECIVAAIRQLANDKELRKRLGETARADMVSQFSRRAIAVRSIEILG